MSFGPKSYSAQLMKAWCSPRKLNPPQPMSTELNPWPA